MNHSEIAKAIKTMQAFIDGKKCEVKSKHSHMWSPLQDSPIWNFGASDYRIKPTPRRFWIVEWPTRIHVYDSASAATEAARQRFCDTLGRIIPVTENGL